MRIFDLVQIYNEFKSSSDGASTTGVHHLNSMTGGGSSSTSELKDHSALSTPTITRWLIDGSIDWLIDLMD